MESSEYERKKDARRENRLKHITNELKNLLHDSFPEEEKNFEIGYEEIHERYDNMVGQKVIVPIRDSPAYRIFIRPKSHPDEKYEIMHLFRPDIDHFVKKENIRSEYQIPCFKDNIEKAIKKKKYS